MYLVHLSFREEQWFVCFTVTCSSGQPPWFCNNPGSAGTGSWQVADCSVKKKEGRNKRILCQQISIKTTTHQPNIREHAWLRKQADTCSLIRVSESVHMSNEPPSCPTSAPLLLKMMPQPPGVTVMRTCCDTGVHLREALSCSISTFLYSRPRSAENRNAVSCCVWVFGTVSSEEEQKMVCIRTVRREQRRQ